MLGKHSGSHSVIDAYAKIGLILSDLEARSLLDMIRNHATLTKCMPSIDDLKRFYLENAACTGVTPS